MESTMRNRRQAPSALDAFIAKKAEIDAMLARLMELSDDRFNVHPDKIHSGHVGNFESYAALLRRLSAAAFQEGEYAA
jgi:hypothetical protein